MRFRRSSRLRDSAGFRAVLRGGRRTTARHFLVYALANGLDCARLGLIVGARAERSAVRRNSFKRLVREAFRARQAELAGLDVVVQLRVGGSDRPVGRALLDELNGIFAILSKWRASSSD